MHNIAGHASEALQRAAGFDVEDLCVDVIYWFDKSTKRKGILGSSAVSATVTTVRLSVCGGLVWRRLYTEFYSSITHCKATLDLKQNHNPGSKGWLLPLKSH